MGNYKVLLSVKHKVTPLWQVWADLTPSVCTSTGENP